MKTKSFLILFAVCFSWLFSSSSVFADQGSQKSEDKTEAPYFWAPSEKEGVDPLPLKSTDVNVRIEGMLATVTVRQTYRNEGQIPIEASYVFPGSTRSAVNDLRFEVGDRLIIAEIKEKAEAKATYEAAKKEGKRTVLLEQHRPNVFQMKVANILPADVITVELVFTETLPRREGDYEFVYPTVVGPRYSQDSVTESEGVNDWVSSPFLLPETEVAAPRFALAVEMIQGQPIKRVGSPSHSVEIEFPEPNRATLVLGEEAGREDNRDFILRYSLADSEPTAGVLVTKTEEGGYFLLNIEPPTALPPGVSIPREYLFLLDVSGSMHGFPLNVSKKILGELIGDLGSGDSFNILAFAGGSEIFSEPDSSPVTASSQARALKWIENLQGSGGTELLPALKRVLKLPRSEGVARTVVVLTDGYVTVEKEAFELIRNSLGEANLFAFGIGNSVNRHLIEGMARAGGGEDFVATGPKEGQVVADRLIDMIRHPVLTDIHLSIDGLEGVELFPAKQPDLFLAKPIRVMGSYSGDWRGTMVLTGRNGTNEFSQTLDLAGVGIAEAESIGILWAREKIRHLMDLRAFEREDGIRQAVVELGLKFHLLTQYTSFVAVEQEIVRTEGELETVKQPSPLPAGVSAMAVGAGIPASPEPTTVGLLLIAGLCLVLQLHSWKKKGKVE